MLSTFRRFIPAALAAVCAVSVAACSADVPATGAHSSTAGNELSYKVKRGELPEFLGEEFTTDGTDTEMADPLPKTQIFHDVRGGEHPDFYRVIVEFKRDSSAEKITDSPSSITHTQWVTEGTGLGKGDKLNVEGAELLDVVVDNTTTPMDDEQQKFYYAGEKNLKFGPIDVAIDGTYEGKTHVVIGMDRKREYQVTYLTDPTRVVIDLKK